ncbi:hypothetical protein TTRE_0000243501 [Trichuris trichiura]|uniref:Uncharacterized protein n=1 Tax=Trichuris trichiura TaxID=36087 RepID=A0A077Z675_TRITR|nr:hypothetical protein TTRE_0000243501 [Trichuris trichiura]
MQKKPYVIPSVFKGGKSKSLTVDKGVSEAANEIKSKKHVYMVPAGNKYRNPSAQAKWRQNVKGASGYMAFSTRKVEGDGTQMENKGDKVSPSTLPPGDGMKANRSSFRRKLTCDLFWQKTETPQAATGKGGRRNRFSASSVASQNPDDQQTGFSAWMTDLLSFGRPGSIENTQGRKITAFSTVKQHLIQSFVRNGNEPEMTSRFVAIIVVWITCAIICLYLIDLHECIGDWYHAGEKYPWETTSACFYPVTLLENPNYKGKQN